MRESVLHAILFIIKNSNSINDVILKWRSLKSDKIELLLPTKPCSSPEWSLQRAENSRTRATCQYDQCYDHDKAEMR